MKKILIVLLLLSALVFAESGNLSYALGELKSSTMNFMLISSFFLFIGGVIFAGIGALVYYSKIRGKEDPPTLFKALAFGFGGLGALALIGAILSIVISILTPFLIDSMTVV